jgi:hypothetical protein
VANEEAHAVHIWPNVGNRTFDEPIALTVPEPISLVYGDFNHDGNGDLAIASRQETGEVYLAFGTGKDGMGGLQSFLVGGRPTRLVTGDLNGDDALDIAASLSDPGSGLAVLLNDDAGGFEPYLHYPISNDPAAIDVGDFDGDGVFDIATGHGGILPPGYVTVHKGDGSGAFPSRTDVYVDCGSAVVAMSAVDLNEDGISDLVVVSLDRHLAVLFGRKGKGLSVGDCYDVPDSSSDLELVDVTGDSILDVLMPAGGPNTVYVLRGGPAGTFTLENPSYGVGASAVDVAVGHLDEDGQVDLVTANVEGDGVSLLWSTGAVVNVSEGAATGTMTSTIEPFSAAARPNPSRLGTFVPMGPAGATGMVEVQVYDASGKRVARFLRNVDGAIGGVWWDGMDGSGRPVSPGVYHLVLSDESDTRLVVSRVVVAR